MSNNNYNYYDNNNNYNQAPIPDKNAPRTSKPLISDENQKALLDGSKKALSAGLNGLIWGAKKLSQKAEEHQVKEKTIAAYKSAKQKSDESGFTDYAKEKGAYAATNLKDGAVIAGTYTYKGTKEAYNWHQEGKLAEKSVDAFKDGAYNAGSYTKDLYGQATTKMEEKYDQHYNNYDNQGNNYDNQGYDNQGYDQKYDYNQDNQGYDKGYDQGYDQNYNQNYDQNYNQNYDQNHNENQGYDVPYGEPVQNQGYDVPFGEPMDDQNPYEKKEKSVGGINIPVGENGHKISGITYDQINFKQGADGRAQIGVDFNDDQKKEIANYGMSVAKDNMTMDNAKIAANYAKNNSKEVMGYASSFASAAWGATKDNYKK